MTYKRFEDLPVWREAICLAEGVYDLTEKAGKAISWSGRDQIERAALSVSNNIAEGFERGTTNELLYFLYIARGSAGEVRSMLCFFERRCSLSNFKSDISDLKPTAESCSRQLRAWADKLQNSDIKGQRHLNAASRSNWEKRDSAQKSRSVFEETQRDIIAKLPAEHPLRQQWDARQK